MAEEAAVGKWSYEIDYTRRIVNLHENGNASVFAMFFDWITTPDDIEDHLSATHDEYAERRKCYLIARDQLIDEGLIKE